MPVLFLSEKDYDLMAVIRPLLQVRAGPERPVTLPRISDTDIQMSDTDGVRFQNKSRGGAATDAAALVDTCLSD